MDIDEKCRTCLDYNGPFLSIYDKSTESCLAYLIIRNFTQTKPDRDDGMPNKVCTSCFREIEICYSFWKKCRKSDETLRQLPKDAFSNNQQNASDAVLKANVEQMLDGQKEYTAVEVKTSKDVTNVEVKEEPSHDCFNAESLMEHAPVKSELTQQILVLSAKEEDVSQDFMPVNARGSTRSQKVSEPSTQSLKRKPGASFKNPLKTHADVQKTFKSKAVKENQAHSDKRAIRKREKAFQCSLCNKRFTSKLTLKNHQLIHTGVKTFCCNFCDMRFYQNGPMQSHMRTHTGEKPYQCKKCDYTSATQSTLRSHMQAHSGQKPYQCSECQKCFTRRTALRQHLRIHSGEKPFQCRFCSKNFVRQDNLKLHEAIHTGERNFVCNFCDMKFTQKQILQGHIRTHTGEKPFKCDICGLRFTRIANLRTHKRRHTGEHKTNYFGKSFDTMSLSFDHNTQNKDNQLMGATNNDQQLTEIEHMKIQKNEHGKTVLTDGLFQDKIVKVEKGCIEEELLQVPEVVIKLDPEEEEAYNVENQHKF